MTSAPGNTPIRRILGKFRWIARILSMNSSGRGDFSPSRELTKLAPLGILIGAVASLVAWFLLKLIQLFTNLFFFADASFIERSPGANHLGLAVIAIPVLGSLIIGLMARFGSEKIRGHGIPEALEAILFGKSLMQPKVAALKPLSSAVSIGSGGPFGAEGPIIMTGGAFGSIFAQLFDLTSAERKTLLVAGAAAGMSAVFAAPISAVLLAVELLLFEWRPRSLVPVALASITAAGIRPYLLGSGPLFPLTAQFDTSLMILCYAGLVGITAAAFSSVISSALYRLEDAFGKLPIHWMWWPAIGGLVVGIGGYLNPRVLGVGYDVISDLLHDRIALDATLGLVSLKTFVWIVALASGTSGGVLAPLLIMGAALGSIEGAFIPAASGSFWALVSMAAVLGGMMRSPFTACLFALELTHAVSALPTLLTASVCSYAFTVLFMKRSILTEKVARRGFDVFREYGVDPLEKVRVEECMSRPVTTIPVNLNVTEAAKRFVSNGARHRGYPVVDSEKALVGVLTTGDLLALMGSQPEARVGDVLPRSTVIVVSAKDSCRLAAERMATNGIGRLPVVSEANRNHLLGIITRSDLLKARLRSAGEENDRQRFIRLKNWLTSVRTLK